MSNVSFSLENKVVVLVGAAGILGSRVAEAFVEHGATIVLLDRDGEKLIQLKNHLQSISESLVRSYELDITDYTEFEAVISEIENSVGNIDVLLNNAAAKSKNFFEPFETFPIEDWNNVMAVNTTAVMIGCQLVGSRMAQRGCGSIINTLSVYGIVAPDQRIYEGSMYEGKKINTPAIYSTSKAAVWGLTKYLAAYWGEKGIRVNAVTPGGVFSGQNDMFVSKYSARVPLGKMADKDDMSGAFI
ncbi:MAG: SDR family NAD(P)-dependent oxidoreductase [Pseudomonadales bacterium]|uniref:SDR family NAD(P)-dependent oxidoreductase n=1 Tax=Moritella sp. TaxID=78556 RepID=UPI0025F4BABE|nr:SDR family NAD(P)-dependent oxidoreductase [Moritella sp.]MCJ8314569.1 SDR family NAD(P)-dependent oxidoreductase [Pseudomonadales bacterium]